MLKGNHQIGAGPPGLLKQSFKGSLQSSKSLSYWWPDTRFGKDGPSTTRNL